MKDPAQDKQGSRLFTLACEDRELTCPDGQRFRCAIGKNGYVDGSEGREGDGKTPLGTYAFRFGFYRADRVERPDSTLNFRAIREDDGWCDAPKNPAYNRFVRLPYGSRCEAMWRGDHAYDICVVLGHNDAPPMPGLGSAIFLHLMKEDYKPTLGCAAVSAPDMRKILKQMRLGDQIEFTA